jgi:hypothetical protein
VRFQPDDPSPLFTLPRRGRSPRMNQNNSTISLRYEGIDALEKDAKEPFASDATNKNLGFLGLSGPTDEAPDYILTNQIGPNGRPISFVFVGKADEDDGDSVFLNVDRLKESVNFHLIEASVVYPLFYDTLFSDLRLALTSAVSAARSLGLRIWSNYKTHTGVT